MQVLCFVRLGLFMEKVYHFGKCFFLQKRVCGTGHYKLFWKMCLFAWKDLIQRLESFLGGMRLFLVT